MLNTGVHTQSVAIKTVYFDLDGVLADFVEGYSTLYGDITNKDQLNENKARFAKDQFFRNLPVLKNGLRLFRLVEGLGYTPVILTATGHNNYLVNREHKLNWVREHLGEYEFIGVKKAKDKAFLAMNDRLLIDDRMKSTVPFSHAGGISHLYIEDDLAYNVDEIARILIDGVY